MGIGSFLFYQGMKAGGKNFSRRSRHRKSQMKFWSGKRGKSFLENNQWSFANRQAKRYGGNGLFGMN